MSVPRVIARCPQCSAEVLPNGVCPVCESLARLRETALLTGNMRALPGRRPARKGLRALPDELPMSGQDAALPVGDR